jgi:hypothetical protein
MVTRLAREMPGRTVHVTAGSAYVGGELKHLPDSVTRTTRLRSNAALHDLLRSGPGRGDGCGRRETACRLSR